LCNLENKYFVSKTIQKLVIDENVVVDDQTEILKQAKHFYEKLCKKQDFLKKVNISTEIPYNDMPKLTENQKQSLEGDISLPELTQEGNWTPIF
jgi:hypothetical protein